MLPLTVLPACLGTVAVTLFGDLGVSERHPLRDPRRKPFERGGSDTFELEDVDVGELTKLRLEHDIDVTGISFSQTHLGHLYRSHVLTTNK